MLGTKIKFEGVKGVGTVELDLQEDQRVYTLIGTNGVGKTKTLEALFQVLFFTNQSLFAKGLPDLQWAFRSCHQPNYEIILSQVEASQSYSEAFSLGLSGEESHYKSILEFVGSVDEKERWHELPVVYLASQSRGFIEHNEVVLDSKPVSIGSFQKRKSDYFEKTIRGISRGFSSLNMDINTEQWFVTLAQSSNRFQKGSDNREIEISTVLKLLNMLDGRIDPEYLEIDGDGRVSLKVEGQSCELSHLSTGFASIVKIIQAIVSGYGAFTNENNLEHVKGIVLIDEIESHLHLTWQAKIIPQLKQLFPNTTFYITTHSSIVLSQLQEGEAYRLARDDDDGAVRTKLLKRPNNSAMIDLLKDAFDIDLNKIKRENMHTNNQKIVNQKLLDLLSEVDD